MGQKPENHIVKICFPLPMPPILKIFVGSYLQMVDSTYKPVRRVLGNIPVHLSSFHPSWRQGLLTRANS